MIRQHVSKISMTSSYSQDYFANLIICHRCNFDRSLDGLKCLLKCCYGIFVHLTFHIIHPTWKQLCALMNEIFARNSTSHSHAYRSWNADLTYLTGSASSGALEKEVWQLTKLLFVYSGIRNSEGSGRIQGILGLDYIPALGAQAFENRQWWQGVGSGSWSIS